MELAAEADLQAVVNRCRARSLVLELKRVLELAARRHAGGGQGGVRRHEQVKLRALRPHVADREDDVAGNLVLDRKIPRLTVGRAKVRIDGVSVARDAG